MGKTCRYLKRDIWEKPLMSYKSTISMGKTSRCPIKNTISMGKTIDVIKKYNICVKSQ